MKIANNVLCNINTLNRYDSTLPLTLMAVANQSVLPKYLVIFDDNEIDIDIREITHYRHIFNILTNKGVQWSVAHGAKKGTHYNHQKANKAGTELVWRLDDDTVPEPNVLENLLEHMKPDVGAVGGSILTVPGFADSYNWQSITGKIDNIMDEPNIQWYRITHPKIVEHLHCSFLYRANVVDYCLCLSRVAHREESLFTWQLHNKGYKVLVIPNTITWHLMNDSGGNRTKDLAKHEMFLQDDVIFRNFVHFKDNTIVVLNCGMGDHVVFKHMMHEIKNPIIFTCYPEIVPGKSMAEAIQAFGANLDEFSIYKKMLEWNWKFSLEDAFRKMYVDL